MNTDNFYTFDDYMRDNPPNEKEMLLMSLASFVMEIDMDFDGNSEKAYYDCMKAFAKKTHIRYRRLRKIIELKAFPSFKEMHRMARAKEDTLSVSPRGNFTVTVPFSWREALQKEADRQGTTAESLAVKLLSEKFNEVFPSVVKDG